MNSLYVYSGTYASVRVKKLLTTSQRELVLDSASNEAVRLVLEDTPLAPYLTVGLPIKAALEDFFLNEKKQLYLSTENRTVLDLLFLSHDYANLKIVVFGLNKQQSDVEIISSCSSRGTINPQKLLNLYRSDTLVFDYPELADTAKKLATNNSPENNKFDAAHLTHLKSVAALQSDEFVNDYVSLLIDLYNIRMRLRVLYHHDNDSLTVTGELVPGGNIRPDQLETNETIGQVLKNFKIGWDLQNTLSAIEASGDFSELEKQTDNLLLQFIKDRSLEVHSVASHYGYIFALNEQEQFINAVVAAHNAKLDRTILRKLLRNSFNHYV